MKHNYNVLGIGRTPLTTHTTAITTQLTATKDTYIRQLSLPLALFYATQTIDNTTNNGTTLHPNYTFDKSHLQSYYPLYILFDDNTKRHVIQTHINLK